MSPSMDGSLSINNKSPAQSVFVLISFTVISVFVCEVGYPVTLIILLPKSKFLLSLALIKILGAIRIDSSGGILRYLKFVLS